MSINVTLQRGIVNHADANPISCNEHRKSIYARNNPLPKLANAIETPRTSSLRPSKAGTDPTAALLLCVCEADEPVAVLPVEVPEAVPVEDVLLPVTLADFWGPITPVAVCVTCALLATPLTLGMLVAPALKSTTLLVVELKLVCARAMRLFCRS